jgi:hypothetical protein
MKNFLSLIALILVLATSCGGDTNMDDFRDGVLDEEHRIFVSSTATNGDISGLFGADMYCKDLASSAGLKRTYKALLSTSSSNAADRLELNGPIYVFDSNGSKVEIASAFSFWNTDSESLSQSVTYDESGTSYAGVDVWSGGDSEGRYQSGFNDVCLDWMSSLSTDDGDYGENNFTDGRWLEANKDSCDIGKRIYCISQ